MHHNEVNWHRCGVLIVNFEHIHEPTAFIVGSESVFACYVRNRLKNLTFNIKRIRGN